MRDQPDILRHSTPPRLKFWMATVLCVAAVIAAGGIGLRLYNEHRAADWANDQDIRTVQLVKLSKAQGGALILPGDVQPWINAPIYARVSGYLRKWYADIGTPVKAGQLLADLDTPDLDGQVAQGNADLNTAIANQKLSEVTAQRWDELLKQGAVARQDADSKDSDLAAKNAMVASAKANLDHLRAMESFKHLVAPFNGIVTSRAVDVGALVLVGTPGATPLFNVADETKLRIYVRVPQADASAVNRGTVATFTVPELPGHDFTAKLAASADAVVSSSGTQLLQFQVDNPQGLIRPGDYAEMRFAIPGAQGAVHVPATALMFRDQGMMVATVDPASRVRLKVVTIRRDLGTNVEVGSGLSPADRVIDNPPDALREGDVVKIQAPDKDNS
ncbi:MAG TPA: efflux RND transporter periplasmic adaptor subunit [Rhizomicrobium sp.]|jgi:RND family efflux transporter MFP subunit|nr:efflux RND transporter periplasmic adaptor subunit [Rhizomicrobium sp.]